MKFNIEKFTNYTFLAICAFSLLGGIFAWTDIKAGVIICFLLALGSLCAIGIVTLINELYKANKK